MEPGLDECGGVDFQVGAGVQGGAQRAGPCNQKDGFDLKHGTALWVRTVKLRTICVMSHSMTTPRGNHDVVTPRRILRPAELEMRTASLRAGSRNKAVDRQAQVPSRPSLNLLLRRSDR